MSTADPLASMESAAELVAFLTGIKQVFLREGWTVANAEIGALEMFRMATTRQQQQQGG